MARTILDSDFRSWEVFTNTGRSGFAKPPRIVFRCRSDRSVPSRMAEYTEEEPGAATFVEEASPGELLELWNQAEPLS